MGRVCLLTMEAGGQIALRGARRWEREGEQVVRCHRATVEHWVDVTLLLMKSCDM